MKASFDQARRPLRIKVGDYAYVYYPRTFKMRKLTPKAFGPFPVTKVSLMPGTGDPVGITVNMGTDEMPEEKRFARARIYPFSYVQRDVDWNALSKRAEEMRGGTQEFLRKYDRAIDLTTPTGGGQRRLDDNESVDIDDIIPGAMPMHDYINEERIRRLHEPVAPEPQRGAPGQ